MLIDQSPNLGNFCHVCFNELPTFRNLIIIPSGSLGGIAMPLPNARIGSLHYPAKSAIVRDNFKMR
jgi:hypothetical protein